MIALFDIGNSRIKWARFVHEPVQNLAPAELRDVGGAERAAHTLDELAALYWSGWPVPQQVIVSTVTNDEYWQQFQHWCRQHWDLTPLRVASEKKGFGLRNAYARPEELGSDRWAAMVAAHHLLHRETCIIDAGTAITVDFLSAEGQHLGGYIIPGLELMWRSLVQGTGAIELPSWPFSAETKEAAELDINSVPGTSTAECIEHGLIMAATGLVEESCKKMEIIRGKPFYRLLTGGQARLLTVSLTASPGVRAQIEENLVLLGLAQMAAKIVH